MTGKFLNRVILFAGLVLLVNDLSAQNHLLVKPPVAYPSQSKPPTEQSKLKTASPQPQTTELPPASEKITYVYLEQADYMTGNQELYPDAQLIEGNVRFRHDNVVLTCDSAHFYQLSNSFNAYGHIVITQGDTLFIYGDALYYNGNTKLARLRKNVRMVNREVTLTTDSLNYDRINNVGYYFNNGKIRDEVNILTSELGHYYPGRKTAEFKKNVKLDNPKFIMNSDTLHYNTDTKVAGIIGPTFIVYDTTTHIYSERGWYHTVTEQATLLDNSYVQHDSGKQLVADTIFYDKQQGKGEGFTHVILLDTVRKVSLYGNYGYYIEQSEQGMVTDSAYMVEASSVDTLYMHADTLYTFAEQFTVTIAPPTDSIAEQTDSISVPMAYVPVLKDTSCKVVLGFPNVRFYRHDIQGVSDSACYNTRDSVLHLLKKPVFWTDNRQLTGDTVRIFSENGDISRVHVTGQGIVCEQIDSIRYNQMAGKELLGYISENHLRQVDVNGSAQTVYFPHNEAGDIIGMNLMKCSYIVIYIKKDNKIDRIVFTTSPSGNMIPLRDVSPEEMYLRNFSWQAVIRPVNRYDIFRSTASTLALSGKGTEQNQDTGKRRTRRAADSAGTDPSSRTTTATPDRPSGFSAPASLPPETTFGKPAELSSSKK
jgi:lipopolysaccharide export system protein LptA